MHREKNSLPHDFDAEYMKRVSKKDFLEAHKHLEDDFDLVQIYEQYNPGKEAVTAPKDKEKANG